MTTEVAMSSSPGVPSARTEQALLIVFADLTRFTVNARATSAGALAELLDGYYRHAESLVTAIGGRLVKFMGDAFLAVWTEERAGAGVAALPALKRDIDAWMAARGWDSRVVVKAHFGRAVVGPFGLGERFDVIGSEVNLAATLPARTVSLSAEAFRCLENGERKAYKKHTAPVVYIPVDDPRP
jgi:class 3 adenylate cyclase